MRNKQILSKQLRVLTNVCSRLNIEPIIVQNYSITPKGSLMTICNQSFLRPLTPGNHQSTSVIIIFPPLQYHRNETVVWDLCSFT